MKLSIVILNYNVRYFLELCLKSVEAATDAIDSEIIVVDNNSSDDSCKMVTQLFPKVFLIENKENYGFSKANNIGVSQAQGQYVCVLNPDTVVAEDTFKTLLKFAEETQNLGIVGCKLIDGAGMFLPESKRNIPTPKVAIKKILGYSKSYYALHLKEDEIGKADILVGAFMFMKKSIYNEFKGFDEDYFMYGEDIDLSYRVLKAGYDNYYYGKTTIVHFKGESTLKDSTYAIRFYQAMEVFYKKHFKRNVLFDIMVTLGTNFISIFKSKSAGELKARNQNDEIVLDNNLLSFKEIINAFENKSGKFKIRPKNSNFIIGSNSSKIRGEVNILN